MRLQSCRGLLPPVIALLACLHAFAAVAAEAAPSAVLQVQAVLEPRVSDQAFEVRAVLIAVASESPLAARAKLSPPAPKAACDAPNALFADGFEGMTF